MAFQPGSLTSFTFCILMMLVLHLPTPPIHYPSSTFCFYFSSFVEKRVLGRRGGEKLCGDCAMQLCMSAQRCESLDSCKTRNLLPPPPPPLPSPFLPFFFLFFFFLLFPLSFFFLLLPLRLRRLLLLLLTLSPLLSPPLSPPLSFLHLSFSLLRLNVLFCVDVVFFFAVLIKRLSSYFSSLPNQHRHGRNSPWVCE